MIINNDPSLWSGTFQTSLPAGTYCDVIHDTNTSPTICESNGYVVSSSGTFVATVQAFDAIAIYVNSFTNIISPTVAVTFQVTVTTTYGQDIYITGSIPELSDWDPYTAIQLSPADYTQSNPVWFVSVALPSDTTFQYKYVCIQSNGTVTWEADPNRSYTTGSGGSATQDDVWQS